MKLLVASNWSPEKLNEMREAYPTVDLVHATEPVDVLREIEDAEVVIGRISRDAFLAARKLRWIQCDGAGIETMAGIPEIAASDIPMTNTRGAHADTIAEHTFGMLICLARNFRGHFEAQEAHRYRAPYDGFPVGLAGLTIGIIGLGNIGKAIAKRAHAFDMTVNAVDAQEIEPPGYVSHCGLLDDLPTLLSESDIVAVAAPDTPRTRGMLGPNELALMKPTAFLLVVSRGGIIDEDALVTMLREGKLGGAGLDVQATEPLPADSPLWDTPNLILTPHSSGRSRRTTATSSSIVRENLKRYLAGEPLINLVDKQLGY